MILFLYIYSISAIIQIAFYLLVVRRLANYQPPTFSDVEWPAVSVIICARDEATNLQIHLPQILNQDYPNYEVIVVNDHSTDESLAILQKFAKKFHHLKIIQAKATKNQLKGKKKCVAARH